MNYWLTNAKQKRKKTTQIPHHRNDNWKISTNTEENKGITDYYFVLFFFTSKLECVDQIEELSSRI